MYSAIFSCSFRRRSLDERSSNTKSGQIFANFFISRLGILSYRFWEIHDASGARIALFGRVKPAEESKTRPPCSRAQIPSSMMRLAFCSPLSLNAGAMMINSPFAVCSIRRSRLSAQKRSNCLRLSLIAGRRRTIIAPSTMAASSPTSRSAAGASRVAVSCMAVNGL